MNFWAKFCYFKYNFKTKDYTELQKLDCFNLYKKWELFLFELKPYKLLLMVTKYKKLKYNKTTRYKQFEEKIIEVKKWLGTWNSKQVKIHS